MKYSTYHAHTTYCDGKSTAEEMILSAIDKGCPEIGFSGHSPLPGLRWPMSEEDVGKYFHEIISLREKYKARINVFVGIEQDQESEMIDLPFDYVLGSTHAVNVLGRRIDVDGPIDFIKDSIKECFGGDPYAYCEAYYKKVARIYEDTHCDIIGHFDLITKYIESDPIFSESDTRYIKARDEALEALLETPAVFEVNTGAISRGYRTTPYPNPYVLERIKATGKPIVVNSDSHKSDTVAFLIEETAEKLVSKGFKCLTSLEEILSFSRGKF